MKESDRNSALPGCRDRMAKITLCDVQRRGERGKQFESLATGNRGGGATLKGGDV